MTWPGSLSDGAGLFRQRRCVIDISWMGKGEMREMCLRFAQKERVKHKPSVERGQACPPIFRE
jgi:hypothetical protein